MAMTGRLFTGKPVTRPAHLGPMACATEVTASTVAMDTAARVATSAGEARARVSVAVWGGPRRSHTVSRHTAAANGTTVSGPRGMMPSSPAASRKADAARHGGDHGGRARSGHEQGRGEVGDV